MSEPELDPELTALEASLRGLQPCSGLARDAVLFEAGRAAARPDRRWPAATAVSTMTAFVLGWLLWRQPDRLPPEPETRVVIVEKIVEKIVPGPAPSVEPAAAPATLDLSQDLVDALRRRQEVVQWGVEMLRSGPPQQTTGEALTPRTLPRLSENKIPREF